MGEEDAERVGLMLVRWYELLVRLGFVWDEAHARTDGGRGVWIGPDGEVCDGG